MNYLILLTGIILAVGLSGSIYIAQFLTDENSYLILLPVMATSFGGGALIKYLEKKYPTRNDRADILPSKDYD